MFSNCNTTSQIHFFTLESEREGGANKQGER